jgi:hypothetical protein
MTRPAPAAPSGQQARDDLTPRPAPALFHGSGPHTADATPIGVPPGTSRAIGTGPDGIAYPAGTRPRPEPPETGRGQ